MAWIEEKGMGIEGKKRNGWSNCFQKVILERALRARLRARYQNVPSSILGRKTSVMPLPGSKGGTQGLTEP